MAYTTITNVQEFFGTTFTAETSPTLTQVGQYITDVEEEIDNLSGTTFETVVSKTDYVDVGTPTDIFLTEKYPIHSLTSVSKNTSDDIFTSDAWESVSAIADKTRVLTKYKYGPGKRLLRIVYEYGFDTVPVEVEHLATLLVVNKILSGQAVGDSATQSISVGPISLTNAVGVERIVNLKNEIKEYKRRVGRYKNFTR